MHRTQLTHPPVGLVLALTLAAPGAALAYDEKDAIRDCESRIRSEYHLSDMRDARAERLNDTALHFKVQGLTKVDGDKHPWTCEVKNRHVVAAEYSGPKPKGLGTAEKLAIGTAAAVAGGIAISEMSKRQGSHATAPAASGGSGQGGIPFMNATCPGNLDVHADEGGPIYINGKETQLKKVNNQYYEAKGSGVTLSLSISPDGSPSLSYTGKHGANGICQIARY